MPSPLPAQSLYSTEENFDGHTIYSLTPSSLWDTCPLLCSSPPYSFRSPLPQQPGDSSLLISPVFDFSGYGRVFLLFDHICKVSRTDIACIEIREDVLGAVWHRIPADCYKSLHAGYRQQQFSDASCAEWLTDSVSAVPTDAWWKTECFDLTSEAAYAKVQLRFKLKSGQEGAGRFAFGWLLDNIRLFAGEKNVLPPYLNLTDTVYAGTVSSVGPFRVRFRAEGSLPSAVTATCKVDAQPFVAKIVHNGSREYYFDIPATPYGHTFSYEIGAEDSAGNLFSLSRRFANPFPRDGRDSDAAGIVRLVSPSAHAVKTGTVQPIKVVVRNTGVRDLYSMRLHWSYPGGSGITPWQGRIPADFCSDTIQVATLPVGAESGVLKIWVESPNGSKLRVPDTLFHAWESCDERLHGSYRIGSGGDFPDLESALRKLERCGLSGTTVFALDSGCHTLFLSVSEPDRENDTCKLFFTSFTGKAEDVVLMPDTLHESIVLLEKTGHICFRRLTFRADSSHTQAGSLIQLSDSCHHIRVEGCVFQMGHPERDGILSSGKRGCHHLEFADNRFEGGHAGIFLGGSRMNDYYGICVENNSFESQNAYGLYLLGASFKSVCGNRFFSADAPQTANRQYTGINMYVCNGRSIEANRFRLRTGFCAVSLTGVLPDSVQWLKVANNEIRCNTGLNRTSGFRLGSSCRCLLFAHNSLLVGGDGYGNSCVSVTGLSDSVFWRNNLFAHLGRGSADCVWDFSFPLYGSFPGHYWQGNHYYHPFAGYMQTDHLLTQLEEWQQWHHQDRCATEGEVMFRDTSISLEPAFADPLCLRTDSLCRDIAGRERNSPLTTKGAWHCVGAQPVDAFLFSIVLPDNSLSADSVPLRVVVGNAGSLPLKETGIGFEWNGLQCSSRIPLPSLASGDTVRSGVLAHLHPQPGLNTLKIWIFLPNDTADNHPENDTLEFPLYGCDSALAGDYIVGGAQSDFPDLETAWQILRRCGISAPVRLLLQTGSYAVRLALWGKVPGSDSLNRVCVTSVAQNPDSVLLYRDSSEEGQRAAISFSATSHWLFEQVSIAGSNAVRPSYSIAVECMDSCSDICIRHCRLWAQKPHSTSSVCCGLYSSEVTGNRLEVSGNRFEGGMYGLFLQGQGPSALWRQVDVFDNLFEGHSENSVFLRDVSFGRLSGNSASDFRLQSVEGAEVHANRLHAAGKSCCISLSEVAPSMPAGVLQFRNDEIVSSSALPHCGVEIGKYCHGITFAHNSISMVGSGRGRCLSLQEDATVWGIRFRQNIFCQGSGSDTASVSLSDLRYPSAYGFENNRYGRMPFQDSSACLQLRKGNRAPCLRIQDASDDIFSNSRPVLTSVGAYPPETHDTDACLFRFNSLSGTVSAGASVPLGVLVGNAGDSVLRRFELAWEVDGVLQPASLWQGNLVAGDTVTIVLGTVYPLHSTHVRVFFRHVEGTADADASNDTLETMLFVCDSVMSGDYHIGKDFATLSEAFETLYRCGIRSTVRLLLPDGKQTGPWSFDRRIPGSSAKNRVCVVSETPQMAVLSLEDNAQSGQAVVQCSHTGHLLFKNLCFEIPPLQTDAYGIRLLYDCEDIDIDSCFFLMQMHSRAALVQSTDWGVCGLRFSGNQVIGGNSGLRFSATAARPDSLLFICDNLFSNVRECGIYMRQAQFTDISRNVVKQMYGSDNGFYGIDAGAVRGARMTANRITAQRGFYGLYLSAVSGTDAPLLIANNEIHMQVYSSNCGIYLYNGCKNLNISHNSVLLEGRGMGKCLYTAFRLSGITLRNNHFANLSGTSSSMQNEVLYFYPGNGFSGWQADGNNYYTTGKTLVYCGSAISTMEEWRRFTGKEPNSRSLPPHYADKSVSLKLSDYDSLACPLLPEVPFDMEGLERSVVTTMGAHQSVSGYSYDWCLYAFDSLETGVECPEVFQKLWIRMRNEGQDTVDLSLHPLEVHVQVEGPLHLNATVFLNDGILPPRQSGRYLLLPRLALGRSGRYCITAYVSDPSDGNPENDTIKSVFTLQRTQLPLATNMEDADTLFVFSVIQGKSAWFAERSGEEPYARFGKARLCFPSGAGRGTVARAELPPTDLSGLRNPLLSLWYARDGKNRAEPDKVRVLVVVAGDAIVHEAAVLYRYKQGLVQPAWERADVDLSAYGGSCVRIVLEGVGFGGGNQYIDSLRISGLPLLRLECAPVPESVRDCQIGLKGLSVAVSNPSAQPFVADTVRLQYRLSAPQQQSGLLKKRLQLPAYGSDTIVVDPAFVWETNSVYKMEALLSADSLAVADTLCQSISTVVDVCLQQMELPDSAFPLERIVPSIVVRNSGSLDVYRVPLEILLNDSSLHADTIAFLAAGDSLRYRYLAGFAAPDTTGYFTMEMRSMLECDADFADNSCFAPVLLRQNTDTISVTEHAEVCRDIRLYPNPSRQDGLLMIRLSAAMQVCAELFNPQGQCIYRIDTQCSEGENRLRLPAPPSVGIYFCKVRYGDVQWTGKWVVM